MTGDMVSVVIPVYNRPDMAITAIKSVLNQTYQNFEIIVVDDGSSPALSLSSDLLAQGNISVLRFKENLGVSAARNAGAKAAKGQWIAWLDSDDYWHQEKLSKQMDWLAKNKEDHAITALATGYQYFGSDKEDSPKIPIETAHSLLFFSGCWFCPGSTVLISQKLFRQTGGYDERLRRLEDLDWFARMALAGGKLKVVPDTLAYLKTGQKVSYYKVKEAGDLITLKFNKLSPKISSKAKNNLSSYLHLEYAASAIKKDKSYFLGVYHLIISWYYHPRIHLHLYHFWK